MSNKLALTDRIDAVTAKLEAFLPDTPAVVAVAIQAAKALEVRLGRVTSAVDAEMLTTEAARMRDFRKECEGEKKSWSTPLTRMARTWGDKLNPAIELCDRVERAAKAAVLTFQQEKEKEVRGALEAAVSPDDIATVVNEATARPMGVTNRWTFHVLHPSQIPERFRPIDHAALNKEAQKTKEATRIPGGLAICTEHATLR